MSEEKIADALNNLSAAMTGALSDAARNGRNDARIERLESDMQQVRSELRITGADVQALKSDVQAVKSETTKQTPMLQELVDEAKARKAVATTDKERSSRVKSWLLIATGVAALLGILWGSFVYAVSAAQARRPTPASSAPSP